MYACTTKMYNNISNNTPTQFHLVIAVVGNRLIKRELVESYENSASIIGLTFIPNYPIRNVFMAQHWLYQEIIGYIWVSLECHWKHIILSWLESGFADYA